MTGPQHYREAERLLEQAARWENHITDDEQGPLAQIANTRAEAQVHATLALVAASARTAIGEYSGQTESLAVTAWREATE